MNKPVIGGLAPSVAGLTIDKAPDASTAGQKAGPASTAPSSGMDRAAQEMRRHTGARTGRKLVHEFQGRRELLEQAAKAAASVGSELLKLQENGTGIAANIPGAVGRLVADPNVRRLAKTLGEKAVNHVVNRAVNGSDEPDARDRTTPAPPASGRPNPLAHKNRRPSPVSSGPEAHQADAHAARESASVADRHSDVPPEMLIQQSRDQITALAKMCGINPDINPVLSKMNETLKDGAVLNESTMDTLTAALDHVAGIGLAKLQNQVDSTTDPEQKEKLEGNLRMVQQALDELRNQLKAPPKAEEKAHLTPEQEKLAQKTHEQLQMAEFEEMCRALIDSCRMLAELSRKGRKSALELI